MVSVALKAFQIQQDMSLASCQVTLSGFLGLFPIISLAGFHQVEMINNINQMIIS